MNLAVAGGGARSDVDVGVAEPARGAAPNSRSAATMGSSTGAEVIDGTAHEIDPDPRPLETPALPAGVPDFDAARARIAEQGSVTPDQVTTALEHLDDGEIAHVRDAARSARALQQAAGGDEGDIYFRERIAAGIAEGSFRPDASADAATVGAGAHQVVLDALGSRADPATRPTHDQSMYTERELRRDWTEPVHGDDEGQR
jgi:hypothetical protein